MSSISDDSITAMSEPSSDPDGELRMLYYQTQSKDESDDELPLAPAVELQLQQAALKSQSNFDSNNAFTFGVEQEDIDDEVQSTANNSWIDINHNNNKATSNNDKAGEKNAVSNDNNSSHDNNSFRDFTDADDGIHGGDSKPHLVQAKHLHSAISDVSADDSNSNPRGVLPEPTKPATASIFYGNPLSSELAQQLMPPENADIGLTWQATILPDECFDSSNRLKKGIPKSIFDTQTQTIKSRRPTLPIHARDFLSSLTKIKASEYGYNSNDSTNNDRYIFHGILNGWPSLTTLEVLQVEQQRSKKHVLTATPKQVLTGQWLWLNVWKHDDSSANSKPLEQVLKNDAVYRVTLRGAPWTGKGWSPLSPGFCFWYQAIKPDVPHSKPFSYGTNMLHTLSDTTLCTRVHMLSHRYAVPRESARDRLTYHSLCLLEWDHGEYCTVVEAAYMNGIGGYKGRSNWYHDRDQEPMSQLYKDMPPELVSPWRTKQAEIRCFDINVKSLQEFQEYVDQYTGPTLRFLDPNVSFSHAARLTFRSRRHVAQYFINYISRDTTYAELKRNCQTFTADLCSFLAGKKDIVPFHPMARVDYQNRTYLFLYDSHLYIDKKEKKRRQSSIIKSKHDETNNASNALLPNGGQ